MQSSILITLVIYKIFLLGIGLWCKKHSQSNDEFFLGNRQLGPVVASISYCASSSSAWTLLGMSGLAYSVGLSSIWLACGAIIGAAFAWLWIAPRLMEYSHRRNLLTLTEFFADEAQSNHASRIRLLASGIILISFIFYISAQFQGAGNTFESIFKLGFTESIVLGGLVIVVYTLMGGFSAVSLTDTIQGLMMLFAALLLPIIAVLKAGGFQQIYEQLATQDPKLISLHFSHSGLAAIGVLLGGLSVGLSTFGQPHLASRFMALRDRKALMQARWMAILWFALVFLGMCLLGLCARALLHEPNTAEGIFFDMNLLLLPPVLGGIMIAAVLSAIMSTADSMLLVGAACISHDMRLANRFPGRELFIARVSMCTLSIMAVLLSLYLPASIFDRALFAWVAIGSAFGPTLFIKLTGCKPKGTATLYSIASGFVLSVILYYLPNTPGDIAERTLPFIFGLTVHLYFLWAKKSGQ